MATKSRGTCPCCFRTQALDAEGRMFRHGYKSPGRGHGYAPHIGGCLASGTFCRLEESPGGTLYVLHLAASDRNVAVERLAAFDAGEVVELLVHCRPTHAEVVAQRSRNPILRTVTRETLDVSAYCRDDEWARLLKEERRKTASRLAAIDEFIAIATGKLLEFHPDTVLPV